MVFHHHGLLRLHVAFEYRKMQICASGEWPEIAFTKRHPLRYGRLWVSLSQDLADHPVLHEGVLIHQSAWSH
jgi:hypothetical protein